MSIMGTALAIPGRPGDGLPFPAGGRRLGEPTRTPLRAARPGAQGGCLVLVVDDNELILRTMDAILERLGHSAQEATCGEAALAWLEEGHQPDLAILDVYMPRMSAEQILGAIRALRPELPVLFITGWVDDRIQTLVDTTPKVGLLAKPFGCAELEAQVNALLEPSGGKPHH